MFKTVVWIAILSPWKDNNKNSKEGLLHTDQYIHSSKQYLQGDCVFAIDRLSKFCCDRRSGMSRVMNHLKGY